jgi:hypothetical protein
MNSKLTIVLELRDTCFGISVQHDRVLSLLLDDIFGTLEQMRLRIAFNQFVGHDRYRFDAFSITP